MSADRPANLPLKVGLHTKLLYGSGAAAVAIEGRVLTTFLLVFYNQVMGLPPERVGLIIMLVTIFDAIIDPLVGQISDNLRSRWGRRHPLMYASALPICLAFFMLWNPPQGLSEDGLFYYLLVCLLGLRLFDTLFEVPAAALAPELAGEYNERTTLYSIRAAFSLVGGLAMVLAAYQIFMPENADGTGGVTERDGYFGYSLTVCIVILASILVSTIGTHHLIPRLSQAPPRIGALNSMKVAFASLTTQAFLVMAAAQMFSSIALGLRQSLEIYFYLYFWNFDQVQISVLTMASIPGSLAGAAVAPMLSRAIGKKAGMIGCMILALLVTVLPVLLRVLGILPGNENPLVFNILLAETVITQVLLIAGTVLTTSMLADIVEEAAVKTGVRSEGLLMSANNLSRKLVSGVGVFAGGLVLATVSFPDNAKQVGVDAPVLVSLGWAYIPAFASFFVASIVLAAFYRIDRARHEANLDALAIAALARADSSGPTEGELQIGTGGQAGGPPSLMGRESDRPS